ncbi:MAG: 23S rRNA (uracil(1939)-C(5))-methyltransferase RlmD [Candidatus Cloacimonetes bacterium 4572_55]|nr:MAG: 23S rRNA (uracil(1939)-C(5))-methyltransferase RlmD [Candidatus Cloacimonetes bacterium 4572_55]
MKRGNEIELQIESLAFGGRGVARFRDFVIFVNQALPGDLVRAKIFKKKKKHAEARVIELIKASPDRIDPPCPYFGACGGCKIQSLSYDKQLYYKRQQVMDSLVRIGNFQDVEVLEALPSPDRIYYRNKMEFSFCNRRWLLDSEIAQKEQVEDRDFALGLHAAGFFDKVVDLKSCLLQSEESGRIVNHTRKYCLDHGLTPYNVRAHTGDFRFLMIREGKNTGGRMINIVTRNYQPQIVEPLAMSLMQAFPDTTSIVNNVTDNMGNVAFGDKEYLLYGESTIDEQLGENRFRISANSFFQTNSVQTERLYDLVKELCEFDGTELVYDLYAGTGSIGIFISDAVRQVIGFELIESCVRDARANADLNHVQNCEFVTADLMNLASYIPTKEKQPDVMIIDPPRAGMHPKTVQAVLDIAPRRIIHVSCNPATLSRDLEILCADRYRLNYVQPVDMFPHTGHVEVVVRLDRL